VSRAQRILVCPLNWGLGHATRCMPIIDALLNRGAEVYLASDGRALSLLKKEYPRLPVFELPAYDIHYESSSMVWNIAKQLPKISAAVFKEKKAIRKIVEKAKIDVIISDNRYGCRSKKCKNIFITHQINIAIPNRRLSLITNKINHYFINSFDTCWIPDFQDEASLAGQLSTSDKDYQYIGVLSRFKKEPVKKEYDLIAVLSGPEPQRSFLEEKIIQQILALNIKALIVQGKTEELERVALSDQVVLVSYLTAKDLNKAMLASDIILTRSGYSSIMDLVNLGKRAILIPTPGQTEQEYLARRLYEKQLFLYQEQATLDIRSALIDSRTYLGFQEQPEAESLLQECLDQLCNI